MLLQPALSLYMQALLELDKGKTRRFRRRVAKARQALGAALQRQREVELFMEDWAEEHAPLELQFGPYLEAVRRHEERVRALAPDTRWFLDQWERR